jgi:imidazolonepropionase-like amidohydrolase
MCLCAAHRHSLSFGLPRPEKVHRCGAGELPMPRRDWLKLAGAGAAALGGFPSRVAAALYGKPVRYEFVSSGVVKGSQTTVSLPDGALDVRFEFIDRGRGPKTHSRITFDKRGFITSLTTTGYSYYKMSVDERFTAGKGKAVWRNAAEREDRIATEPRYYVSIDGSPEELAALARALLRAGGAVPLWPAGEATIKRVRTISVSSGSLTKSVTLYEIAGLDFTASTVWLAPDGSLFMSGSQWGAVVPAGWHAVLPQLFAAQDQRAADNGKLIAATLPQRVGSAIAIEGCALFDAEAGTLVPNASVLLKGDRVVAVGDGSLPVPSDARRIPGAGKTLLPGLWNMHTHMDVSFGPRLLAEGITTVRDPGNEPNYISKMQKQFESGELVGPRILIAGLLDGTGKYTAPIGITTATQAEAAEHVREWKRHGAVQVKLYSSLDPAIVPAIVKEARVQGMRVSGHIPAGMLAQDAIEAGFDEIQHVNFLFLNFMPDIKNRTQTPVRLTAAVERAGTIDLNSAEVRSFLALMKERDIVSDPTVTIFHQSAYQRPRDLASSGFGEIADWLPPQVRRGLLAGSFPVPPGKDAAYRASGDAFLKMIAMMHETGIRIVAGTDDVLVGFDTVRELELYAKAGLTPAAALQTATIVPARVMKLDDTLGSLKPGKIADAIIVHGNPLEDISQLRRVGTTIKGGVLYDARALYATAGVKATPLA